MHLSDLIIQMDKLFLQFFWLDIFLDLTRASFVASYQTVDFSSFV